MNLPNKRLSLNRKLITILTIPLVIVILISCSFLPTGSDGNNTQLTSEAISVQQTMLSQQEEQNVQKTIAAQQATIDAQSAQWTQSAQQPTEAPQQPTSPPQTTVETPEIQTTNPPSSGKLSPEELDEKMKNANILLYENMVADTNTMRYVKATLDKMGLPYDDVGNAGGWLKSHLLSGGPDGKGWDLVIIAAEYKDSNDPQGKLRKGVYGEFFDYALKALNQGASVILEVWYLDKTYNSSAAPLLSKCGVSYENNWIKVPPERMVMFTLDSFNPVLNLPNSGLSFTDVTSQWASIYDIGDYMKKSSKGDATLLIGTIASEKNTHGTAAVCIDNRLILQTFSSHQLTYKNMKPLWENYIYNALKAKFESE